MISINGKSNPNDINLILDRDFERFDSVVLGSIPPIFRIMLDVEENPNYVVMYNFATEDISSYIEQFNSLDSYLSVCASSDQILNGVLYGATKIDTFDKNYFTKHSLFLKLASLKSLSNEELIKLYTEYDLRLQERVLQEVEPYIQLFWEKILSKYGANALSLAFGTTKVSVDQIREINPYLKPENYEKLKELVDKVDINFIESDLYELPKYIDGKRYDAINLSNIYEYLNFGKDATLEGAKRFRDFIMNDLYPHLNLNGNILVSYLYAFSEELKKDFDWMYKEYNGQIPESEGSEIWDLKQQGLTMQNLAYSYLFDVFKDIDTLKIPTSHVEYGYSKDMSHDLAFMLKKTK